MFDVDEARAVHCRVKVGSLRASSWLMPLLNVMLQQKKQLECNITLMGICRVPLRILLTPSRVLGSVWLHLEAINETNGPMSALHCKCLLPVSTAVYFVCVEARPLLHAVGYDGSMHSISPMQETLGSQLTKHTKPIMAV